jgi:hypothetical protein
MQLSDGPGEREPRDELSMILRQLAKVPEGRRQLSAPRIVRDPARPARSYVAVRYVDASSPETMLDRVVGIIDGFRVRVDVEAWTALPRAFDGLAPRILRSIEPAAASRAALDTPRAFHSSWSAREGSRGSLVPSRGLRHFPEAPPFRLAILQH